MFDFFYFYTKNRYYILKNELFLFNKDNLLKKKILIYIYINVFSNFKNFIKGIKSNLSVLGLNIDKLVFLNKFIRGGCKLERSMFNNR